MYKNNPICLFHKSVVLLNNETKHIYAVDFSPLENISSPIVIVKLLLGKSIKGKLRVSQLSEELYNYLSVEPLTHNLYAKNSLLFENNDFQITNENLKHLETQDPFLVSIIKLWGDAFQLYTRNCQSFSDFLSYHYFQELNSYSDIQN